MGINLTAPNPYPYLFFSMLKKIRFNIFLGLSLSFSFSKTLSNNLLYFILLNLKLPKYVNFTSHLMSKYIISLNMNCIWILGFIFYTHPNKIYKFAKSDGYGYWVWISCDFRKRVWMRV